MDRGFIQNLAGTIALDTQVSADQMKKVAGTNHLKV